MALPPLELFSLKKKPPCCRVAFSCSSGSAEGTFSTSLRSLTCRLNHAPRPLGAPHAVCRLRRSTPCVKKRLKAAGGRSRCVVRSLVLANFLIGRSGRSVRVRLRKGWPKVTPRFAVPPTVPPVSNLRAVALREPPQLYRSPRRRYNPLGVPT